MRVLVYPTTQTNSLIQGDFSGKDALSAARNWALSMSRLTPLTLEYGNKKEFYLNGRQVKDDGSDATLAAAFITQFTNQITSVKSILSDKSTFDVCYKQAARKLHPDAKSGSHEKFVELQKARTVLEKYFEGKK